jgi:RluA family pseudouridine synthase
MKILFQDKHLIVIHKPAGLAVYGDGTITGAKEALEGKLNVKIYPVHRLDLDTEGVLLFAKTGETASDLIKAFKLQRIEKEYVALVWGVPTPSAGSIKSPLKKNKSKEMESARTDYRLIERFSGFSLVVAAPKTGRYHQIRRHFDSKGNPVMGDTIYAKKEVIAFGKQHLSHEGLALCASSISFLHPRTKKLLTLTTKPSFAIQY